jgi:DNA polymerase III epsilon subunit family exonuclease
MALAVQGSFDDLGTPLSQVTFVVLDVETTGGSPASASLTEVAAARYCGGEMIATYQTFVRPDERIPPFITALTGISDAMVADAPRIGEMLPSFLEFLSGGVVVGHNVRFDLSFLNHALESTGRERLANSTVDTLALARRLVRDMVPNCKLGTLAATLRLPHQPSHRALTDVLATGDLLHALLERAGTYGIVGLEELLDLPKMVGHPQGAKLKLTNRLPHKPGVYWFSDAAGHVLYVGKATDLHSRVRSYFSGDTRNKVGRLLRQMDAVHHRVCPGPLTAAVLEGRLIRTWAPPFNVQGKVKRLHAGTVVRDALPSTIPSTAAGKKPARKRSVRRRRAWTAEDLAGDPVELLAPFAESVASLSRLQRYEDAARIRDEAERVRHLIVRHRLVESLRRAERTVLLIDGEGTVELDGGLLVETGSLFDNGGGLDPAFAISADGHQNERIIVAQWLRANPYKVRVLECAGAEGIAMPADRVPRLGELCAAYSTVASATTGPEVAGAEVTGAQVAGTEVAGAEVTGAQVAGSASQVSGSTA